MNIPIPTLDDFPTDRANCGNCKQSRSICPRAKSNNTQHNGLIYRNSEVQGIIYLCPNYKGPFKDKELNLFKEEE